MNEPDAIHRRGQALEDEFFHRVDEKLREDLRKSLERNTAREHLAAATGFKNQDLLDHLLDAGFEAPTLAAMALVPTVFIAWADGTVTPAERQAVMSAALQRGLEHTPSALQMIESWLHKHPPRSLWKLWKEYAAALNAAVSPSMADVLKKEITRQAKVVAEASGGTLGFGKISADEQKILDEIAEVYSK